MNATSMKDGVRNEADFSDFRVRYRQAGKMLDPRFDSYVVTGVNPRTGRRQRYVTFDASRRNDLAEYLRAKGIEAEIPVADKGGIP